MSSANTSVWRRWLPRRKQPLNEAVDESVRTFLVPVNEVLVQLAEPLLYEVVPLRALNHAPDIDELRARLITQVRNFQRNAMEAGVDQPTQEHAKYALCTLLDEVIANSDWGQGTWSKQSLLMIFHNETTGGEGFFVRLDAAELKPMENLALLELMYLCLALGLEGRYRIQSEGRAALALRRRQLYESIRLQRSYHPKAQMDEHLLTLSRDYFSRRERSLWWVICLSLMILAGLGAYYLEERSYQQLQALQALRPAQSNAVAQTLTEKLAPDIQAGRLTLIDDGHRVRIILNSAGLFASGGSDIVEQTRVLLLRIASALDDWQGRIQVIGHSDDMPVARRLVSNEALSLTRAQSVLKFLVGEKLDPARFQAEGRGASEPLFPNDSADHRARNRRVEILVYAPL
jgi:type VI secretion system protein ImpK